MYSFSVRLLARKKPKICRSSTPVRINGIKYNSQDLESKLFIPERNQLIVDTYLKYVNGKKTVIFCASVDHAAEIAKLLRDSGVKAEAVSGRDRVEVREKS